MQERVPSNGTVCQWIEFNDTIVRPFNENLIPNECFGGLETQQQWDNRFLRYFTKSVEKSRNAYLLFYERVHPTPAPEGLIVQPPEMILSVPEPTPSLLRQRSLCPDRVRCAGFVDCYSHDDDDDVSFPSPIFLTSIDFVCFLFCCHL